MTEVYEVMETTPVFPGEKPYAYIDVGGKIQGTPCRLNLKAGDRVIIERATPPTASERQ